MTKSYVGCLIFLLPVAASLGYAQQTTKIPKVGILQSASAEASRGNVEAFQAGLRELGYEESKNIVLVLEYRAAEDRNQIAALAAELSHLRVDVIATQGTATRVVKPIITNIPVVFAFSGDPVEAGFVDSLARPATNLHWHEFHGAGPCRKTDRTAQGSSASS